MALVKYNNNSISTISSTGQLAQGSLVPIKTLTASSSATLSFVHGTDGVVLDSTYPIYKFEFINIHPQNDNGMFSFNLSSDTGSNYNVTKTTTSFDAFNAEAGNDAGLRYDGDNNDLAQSTNFQELNYSLGNGDDSNLCGFLNLFNPSQTNYVKHFMASVNYQYFNTYSIQVHTAGYGNTTSAINAIRFQMSSGNIDSGTIKLYGIKDS